ncbi:MAG: 4Fe-4S binding protein, partial [Nitrospirae bacterium]
AGFVSLKYFLFTGLIEPAHPAALVLFVAIVMVSLLFKKGFCGWICPVGTVSQYLWMAGERIFGKNFRLKAQYDIPLRSIKYIVMAFFLVFIGIAMVPNMIVLFFITDYYKIVDVRTMKFFTEMSQTTAIVLLFLFLFSLLYKNFWCRYLCPYGALLGLISKLSPLKIKREEKNCLHCRSCSTHCPALIDVEKEEVIGSAECIGCLTCVSHCPEKDALNVTLRKKVPLRPAYFIASLLIVFYLFVGLGKLTGHWQSEIPYSEYKRILGK